MIEGRVAELHQLIEEEIKRHRYGETPDSLYEPIRYIMSLGGKRIRPLLVLMAYELFDKDPKEIVSQAVAVELFHNFTLMHDDIMDRAPIRRGKPTVHEKWGDNTAILSGDVMMVKSYELFLESGVSNLKEILSFFNTCAVEVCEGQQLDMDFETRTEVTEAEYLEMIRLKTAVLLGFSMRLGAMMAGAGNNPSKLLESFAMNIGVGFQLMDDMLDVFGDASKFGKQEGGDIIANKKTYLLIEALEKANPEERKTLDFWLNVTEFDPAEKVRAVKTVYNQIGIPELSRIKMNEYFDLGLNKLDQLEIHDERKLPLRNFIDALIRRDH